MGRRIASTLFFAALSALFTWAVITGSLKKILAYPMERLGVGLQKTAETSVEEDVLFDDDSTLDWSSPSAEIPEPSDPVDLPQTPVQSPSYYDYVLSSDYFNALLAAYATDLPIGNVTASFTDGAVILSGDAKVEKLSSLFDLPPAVLMFLPETVPCKLFCQPKVSDGQIKVTVTEVRTGYDVLAPVLAKEGVLSSLENFLNGQVKKYLPASYIMESASVSSEGIFVRFSVRE